MGERALSPSSLSFPLQALDVFLRVQSSFPHAKVKAAGFDGFVSDLLEAAPRLDLPVVTGEVRRRAEGGWGVGGRGRGWWGRGVWGVGGGGGCDRGRDQWGEGRLERNGAWCARVGQVQGSFSPALEGPKLAAACVALW